MRALIQRVKKADVRVEGDCIARINAGLLVFLGVRRGDTEREAEYILRKLPLLRLFSDEKHPINRSLNDVGGEILLVSQFTLYGDLRSGNRPEFSEAAPPQEAERLYEFVLNGLRALGISVQCGRFGADMEVSLVNDGPVTILLSREAEASALA